MLDLTTNLYSHDHQQLLLPQGTRLLGTVQSVGNERAAQDVRHLPSRYLSGRIFAGVCEVHRPGPELARPAYGYQSESRLLWRHSLPLPQLAASAGWLRSATWRQHLSRHRPKFAMASREQSAQEGEQVLNHFLNRLPVSSRSRKVLARVCTSALTCLIPSYAEHRVNPTL